MRPGPATVSVIARGKVTAERRAEREVGPWALGIQQSKWQASESQSEAAKLRAWMATQVSLAVRGLSARSNQGRHRAWLGLSTPSRAPPATGQRGAGGGGI